MQFWKQHSNYLCKKLSDNIQEKIFEMPPRCAVRASYVVMKYSETLQVGEFFKGVKLQWGDSFINAAIDY